MPKRAKPSPRMRRDDESPPTLLQSRRRSAVVQPGDSFEISRFCPLCKSPLEHEIRLHTSPYPTVTRGQYIDATLWLVCWGPNYAKEGRGSKVCSYRERIHFSKNNASPERIKDMIETMRFLFTNLTQFTWTTSKVRSGT